MMGEWIMTDYVERFDALVDALRGYNYIEILRYEKRQPVRATVIRAVERELDAPLASSLRGFYGQTDGIRLKWRIKPTLSLDETEKLRQKSTDYYVLIAEYVGDPFANIDILPLADIFLHNKRKTRGAEPGAGRIKVAGNTYTAEALSRSLRPFDLLNEKYCMALAAESGVGNPPAILIEHCGEPASSASCDFESYMEMVLATYGIVEARTKLFGSDAKADSIPQDPRDWQRYYAPKMFSR
jgi:hypothetical protein